MSSVNSIRVPGLATGMDTDTMVKEMLTKEQVKVDKAKQKEQTIKWQQEIYREVITSIKGFQDKFFSITSSNSILTSKSWNTLSVSSSSPNVMTATGSAGASNVNYKFNVIQLAQPPTLESNNFSKDQTLGSDYEIEINGKLISLKSNYKMSDVANTINNNFPQGEVKATYSEMTGKLIIQGNKTGESSEIIVKDISATGEKFFENNFKELPTIIDNQFKIIGTNNNIEILDKNGNKIIPANPIPSQTNNFTIDGITYNITGIGTSDITSNQNVQPIVDNMKAFVEEYNKIMDKVYKLIIQKKSVAYPPLTDAQKEEMSEEEITRWETKAKEGLLRNDSEMSRFMNDMEKAIFGDNMAVLNEMGLRTPDDYNKRGQLYIDVDKFTKALQTNGDKVYELFAKNDGSILDNMKDTMYKYVGTSSSIFAAKAGLENTSSVVKNLYSDQLRIQSELIKSLQRKMDDREQTLYKKFAALESSMNKFNSQMNYLSGTTMQQ